MRFSPRKRSETPGSEAVAIREAVVELIGANRQLLQNPGPPESFVKVNETWTKTRTWGQAIDDPPAGRDWWLRFRDPEERPAHVRPFQLVFAALRNLENVLKHSNHAEAVKAHAILRDIFNSPVYDCEMLPLPPGRILDNHVRGVKRYRSIDDALLDDLVRTFCDSNQPLYTAASGDKRDGGRPPQWLELFELSKKMKFENANVTARAICNKYKQEHPSDPKPTTTQLRDAIRYWKAKEAAVRNRTAANEHSGERKTPGGKRRKTGPPKKS